MTPTNSCSGFPALIGTPRRDRSARDEEPLLSKAQQLNRLGCSVPCLGPYFLSRHCAFCLPKRGYGDLDSSVCRPCLASLALADAKQLPLRSQPSWISATTNRSFDYAFLCAVSLFVQTDATDASTCVADVALRMRPPLGFPRYSSCLVFAEFPRPFP